MNEGLLLAVLLAVSPEAASPAAAASGTTALTVRDAVERALAHAPEIAIARAVADETVAGARIVKSQLNPQIYVNTTPGWSTGAPLSVAGEVPAAAGARIRMTFYDPVERGDELQARARMAVSEAALDDARSDVARRTAAACAKLVADEARVGSARRRLSAEEALVRRERALAREGRRTELDVERAAFEEARARQKLYAAESDRDLDRHELASLVGLPAGSPLSVVDDLELAVPEPEPADAVALALASDGQLRALAEQADALAQSAKLMARLFKPSINAEARYAYVPDAFGYEKYYLNFQENVASIGVSVVLPVLTGGRDSALAAQSRARLEQVEAQRRLRESDLTRQVGQAQAQLARTRLQAGIARRAVALAGEALSQAQAVSREGRGEADAVDRAQLSLSAAEDELALARRDHVDARLQLLAIEGNILSALSAEPPATPEP
jgi:outer membrane protein TolC